MKEVRGDLWNIPCDAVCISTNGYVKKNGENVAGRGCAKEAAEFFPEIPKILGDRIKKYGNVVNLLRHCDGVAILSFPVKPVWREYHVNEDVVAHMRSKFNVGDKVPGWASTAMIQVIEKSAKQLSVLADKHGWKKVLIPRVGAGYGELRWEDVKPVLDKILDDRFVSVTFK